MSSTDLTPEDWETMDEAEREAWAAQRERELHQRARENRADLSATQREQLDLLDTAVEESREEATTTVELGEAEITVSEKTTGEQERLLADIAEADTVTHDVLDDIVRACAMLCVDADEAGYSWSDPAVWDAYHREHGAEELVRAFYTLSDPAMSRMEDLESFRDERHGADDPRDVRGGR